MYATVTTAASLLSSSRTRSLSNPGLRFHLADKAVCVLAGQHLHLDHAAGQVVTALRGTLWVTQDGDVRDWILEAGESKGFDRDADILITAMSDAAIQLDSHCKAAS